MDLYGRSEAVTEHRRFCSAVNWIVDIAVVLILAVLAIRFYGDKATMAGSSMKPVLESDDVVLLDELCYTFSEPGRFDVVSFQVDDGGTERQYIKRIIGLPGETIQIKDGLVMIDGVCPDPEDELYQASVAGSAADPVTLEDGEYFVLGDNRSSSEDSRFPDVGNVRLEQISGRVWLLFSPFLRMKLIT